jgi:hypothetical protein
MRLGMRPHIGKARGIFNARNLPRIRIGPPPALLELHHMVIEQQIHRDGRFK